MHPTAEILFPLERFRQYRDLARAKGYCDPFVPAVGPAYGDGGMLRVVYCGVAARWGGDGREAGSDVDLFASEAAWSATLLVGENTKSAFWRLLDRVLEAIAPHLKPAERRARAAWTNLSKSGRGYGATCPPDRDTSLRSLDVAQLRHEVELLRPELMVCVSGNNLVSTGIEVFRAWPAIMDLSPSVDQTEIRRLPAGGALYWTMHPQGKTREWTSRVVSDSHRLAETLGG